MDKRKLFYEIVGIRDRSDDRLYGYWMVDILWTAEDGLPLRDDGARKIKDQVNMPTGSSKEDILAAIEKKRTDLSAVLKLPGIGITIETDQPPDDVLSLIGTQG